MIYIAPKPQKESGRMYPYVPVFPCSVRWAGDRWCNPPPPMHGMLTQQYLEISGTKEANWPNQSSVYTNCFHVISSAAFRILPSLSAPS